jgi:hypothetical protein
VVYCLILYFHQGIQTIIQKPIQLIWIQSLGKKPDLKELVLKIGKNFISYKCSSITLHTLFFYCARDRTQPLVHARQTLNWTTPSVLVHYTPNSHCQLSHIYETNRYQAIYWKDLLLSILEFWSLILYLKNVISHLKKNKNLLS